jgi:hypothetical protein
LPASAQTVAVPDPGPVPEYIADPISLLPHALGTFHRPISSTNAEAQKYFDQGFQMMYAFARLDAVRSFRESWKRDPNCAICYWGEAWAWGSYLNGPMPAEQSPFAYYAAQKAISLKNVQATQVEKDFIDALAPRYVEKFDPTTRRQQDEAYAESMRKLAEKYPNDLDAVTLYGDALFLLEPRRGSPRSGRSWLRPAPSSWAAASLVPATSSTCRRTRGTRWDAGRTRCDRISRPGTLTSRPTSVRASRSTPITTCTCCSTRRRWMDRAPLPCRAGKDYAKRTGDTMYQVLTLIRFGRFDEVIEIAKRPEREVPAAAWEFA